METLNLKAIPICYKTNAYKLSAKEFNIIKLWLRNHDENYTEHLNIYEPFFVKDKALIKKHELSD